MDTYYRQLSPLKRFSLNRSMRSLVDEFLDLHAWDLRCFHPNEDIGTLVYFYWLRVSAERHYEWCSDQNAEVFTDEFAKEMKERLNIVFNERYFRKREKKMKKYTHMFSL